MRVREALLLFIAALAPASARAQDAGGSASGQDGAIRVVAATSPEPGSLRVVSGFEWLNEHGYITAGHFHERTQSSTSMAWGVTRWLEVSAAVLATTNHDGATRPLFITALGDVDASVRVGGTLFGGRGARVSAGVRGGARMLQGDTQGPKRNVVNPYGYGLLSVEGDPWRISANAGYYVDHSKDLLDPTFKATPGQAYAYGIDDYNAVVGGLALDFPGARFAPLLEATFRDDLDGAPGKPAAVGTGGLRWSPGRGRMTLTAALDVGFSGTEVVPGRVRAPNWNVVGGLTFRLGALRRTAAVAVVVAASANDSDAVPAPTPAATSTPAPVVAPAPAPIPSTSAPAGIISGKVSGSGGAPVVGALVAIRSAGKVQQVTTGAKGEYSATVEGPDVDIAVSAIGYVTQTLKSRITPGKPSTINVKLFKPGKEPK